MRAAEEAREHFDAIRAVYPDEPMLRDEHAAALLALSQLLMRFESIDEARAHAALAATIARDADASFLHDLARVLQQTGEIETAKATAERALALLGADDPRRAEIEAELRQW
jgi:uncharacterized protein HemY